MDKGHEATERKLKALERKINREYSQAAKELEQKLQKYLKSFERKDALKRAALDAGEITDAEYKQWRTGQIMIGKRWTEMRDSLAEDLTNTNKIALSMVNGYMPEVYALNHDYATFEIEKGGNIDTSYTLYDRETVERLMRDNPKLLPKRKIDIPKDLKWNQKLITSAVTQGILQGEPITDIAKRLRKITDMDKNASIRNARTITTGAENAGRVAAAKRAQGMGIDVEQIWIATLDGRTRHTHRQLDGEHRKVGKKFSNGCMFPADPDGPPQEVYNCRCTLGYSVDGVDFDASDLTLRDSRLGSMSYEEWREGHGISKHYNESVAEYNERTKDIKPTQRTQFGDKAGNKTYRFNDEFGSREVKVEIGIEKNHEFIDGYFGNYTRDAEVYKLEDGTKIYFVSGMNKAAQKLTPEIIIQQVTALPESFRKQMQREICVHDVANAADSYWAKAYKMKNFKSYATGGKSIDFWSYTWTYSNRYETGYVRHTLCHEAAHYIDRYDGDKDVDFMFSKSRKWDAAAKADREILGMISPTTYGADVYKATKEWTEDFADSVAEYINSRTLFVGRFPNRTKLIEEILENGKAGWKDA